MLVLSGARLVSCSLAESDAAARRARRQPLIYYFYLRNGPSCFPVSDLAARHARRQPLASTFYLRTDLLPERLDQLRATAFFGGGGQQGAAPQPPQDELAACAAAAASQGCCQAGSDRGFMGDGGAWPALQCGDAAHSARLMCAKDQLWDAVDPDTGLEGMVQDAVPWPAKMSTVAADSMMLACSAALAVTAVLACLLMLLGAG